MTTKTPPAGHAMPERAAALIAHATAHGWDATYAWAADSSGNPFLDVVVGRRLTTEELSARAHEPHQGAHYLYRMTWHSRGLRPGHLHLSAPITAETPNRPRTHNAPQSLRAVRGVIAAHPAPAETNPRSTAQAGGTR